MQCESIAGQADAYACLVRCGLLGKLALRIVAAALLAGGLFWVTRASGSAPASFRRILHTYIAENTLPSGQPQSASTAPSGTAKATGLSWPLTGSVSSAGQGEVMIAAPSGTLVRAASAGRVASTPADAPGADVVVREGSLTLTYGHVGPVYVHKGQLVRAGEVIGEVPHFGPGQTPGIVLQARRAGKPAAVLGLLASP